MTWRINLSKEAERFLGKQEIERDDVSEVIKKSIKKLQGENINVDKEKLKGAWQGFYRGRIGKIRVIFEIDFNSLSVFVENIDFRGGAYKN